MPLILAIEPDRRQAAHLAAVVRNRVEAELILVSTTAKALDAIGNRVPDLVLVPALLSPQDDAALAQALRVIAAAANVQMLTIPVLGPPKEEKSGGVLSALRRKKSTEPEGCDPDVFADQIVSYLEHLALERSYSVVDDDAPEDVEPVAVEPSSAPVIEEFSSELDAAAQTEPPAASFEEPVLAETPQTPVVEPPSASHAHADVAEPIFSAATDETVSFALEEAVRGLFTEQQPETFADTPSHTPAAESWSRSEPETPAIVEEVASAIDPVVIEEPAVVEEISDVVPQVVPEPQSPADAEELFEPIQLEPRSASVTELLNDPDRANADQLVAALEALPLASIEIPEQRDAAPARGRHADRLGEDAPVPTKHSSAPVRQHSEKPADSPPWSRAVASASMAPPLSPRPVAPVATALAPGPSTAAPTPAPATKQARHQSASPEPAAPVPPPAAATKPARHQPAEPEPVAPAVAAAPPAAAHEHHAGKSEKEWVALIESLRLDVERIRTEHDKPSAKSPKSSGKAAAKAAAAATAARPAAAAAAAKPAAAASAKAAKSKKAKPVQDEWGFFDPEQCGFAALLAKLEEVTDEEGTPV